MTKELLELETWAMAQFEHCRRNFETMDTKQAKTSRVVGFAFLALIRAIHCDRKPFRHEAMWDRCEGYQQELTERCMPSS